MNKCFSEQNPVKKTNICQTTVVYLNKNSLKTLKQLLSLFAKSKSSSLSSGILRCYLQAPNFQ